jgi:hypothetical protein
MQPKLLLVFVCAICMAHTIRAQDSLSSEHKGLNFPSSFLTKVDRKTTRLDASLTRQTEKYLLKLAAKEARLKKKLAKIDSVAAKNCFAIDPNASYEALIQKLRSASGKSAATHSGTYMPYIDSLQGSISFLNKNPELLKGSRLLPGDVQQSVTRLRQLQGKMQQADEIKQFVQQRKQTIKNYLAKQTELPSGIANSYKSYSRRAYYYSQQLKEYKETLNDPDKVMKAALAVLNKVPAFTGFMKKNSMLAGLFGIPVEGDQADVLQSVTGLQTRSQVTQSLQSQLGPGGPNVNALVQQNVQSAEGQINVLKQKLNSLGAGNGDLEVPDFKPNRQKTKSFLQRLEYGTNIQSTQAGYFFPTTTDFGLSVGYRLNDKSVIGIGTSYKMGWGKDFRHIKVTQEGLGLRSFLDVKLKGSFYASGGLEYNYQQSFDGLLPPANGIKEGEPSNWQQSGLIGISKVLSLKTKVLKKSRLQLLWDFLSYQQRPQTQAFKFRIGYNF